MIRVKNNLKKSMYLMSMDNFKSKKLGIALIAASLMCSVSTSAFADISNTAKATGTYGGSTINSATDTENVPVTTDRGLSTVLTLAAAPTIDDIGGGNLSYTDGGDTIKYTFVVTNTGKITETNITNDILPQFNGVTGTGSWAFTETSTSGTGVGSLSSLGPSESVTFEGTYTLSDADAFRAAGVTDGITLTVKAMSDDIASASSDTTASSEVTSTVAPGGELELDKTYTMTDANDNPATTAQLGYKITYLYTVTNSGNAAVTDVSIEDAHGSTSLDFNDIQNAAILTESTFISSVGSTLGKIETLEAGAVATFTYEHIVTQPEIDAQ